MSHFPAPEPATQLGYYRLLAPSASVRVSPLCVGGMNFGSAWSAFMGAMPKAEVFALLDFYYDSGGNFIDTANSYQDQESEKLIGEWMQARGTRDDMVIATKFSQTYRQNAKISANHNGNSRKNLHVSVTQSLENLRTNYVDILYVHWCVKPPLDWLITSDGESKGGTGPCLFQS
jgi:aryl-alcohol dehydrogenase-like predicted oxidoreductase